MGRRRYGRRGPKCFIKLFGSWHLQLKTTAGKFSGMTRFMTVARIGGNLLKTVTFSKLLTGLDSSAFFLSFRFSFFLCKKVNVAMCLVLPILLAWRYIPR